MWNLIHQNKVQLLALKRQSQSPKKKVGGKVFVVVKVHALVEGDVDVAEVVTLVVKIQQTGCQLQHQLQHVQGAEEGEDGDNKRKAMKSRIMLQL